MKFSAAIISALALGATAQDFSKANDVVSLNCNFPTKWADFHDSIGGAWDALRQGIDVMKNVALSAKYETAPGSKAYTLARALGKQLYTDAAGATRVVSQGKRNLMARSNSTDLAKRGFVAGGQALEITKIAICGIIKFQIPEVTCAHTDGAAFPC